MNPRAEGAFQLWDGVFPATGADAILAALDAAPAWRRESADFYAFDALAGADAFVRQFEREFAAVAREAHARARDWLGVALVRDAGVRIHRFTAGTGAALHSDAAEPGVRLVVFLGRDTPEEGASLVFADPVTRQGSVVPARHNLGVLFPTESGLHHGVTELGAGRRYSIVFSLRPA